MEEKPEIYAKTFGKFEEADREQFFLDSQELVYGKYSVYNLLLLSQIIDFNNLKPKLELKTVYQLLYDMQQQRFSATRPMRSSGGMSICLCLKPATVSTTVT